MWQKKKNKHFQEIKIQVKERQGKKILFLPRLQKSLSDVKNKYYDHDKKNYKLLTNLLRQRKPLALQASIRGPDGKGINETKDKLLQGANPLSLALAGGGLSSREVPCAARCFGLLRCIFCVCLLLLPLPRPLT